MSETGSLALISAGIALAASVLAGVRAAPVAVIAAATIAAIVVCVGASVVGALGHHFDAVLQFLEPFDGDCLSLLQSGHGSGVAVGGADRDRADGRGLIGFDDVDERALGIALNGGGGNQNYA